MRAISPPEIPRNRLPTRSASIRPGEPAGVDVRAAARGRTAGGSAPAASARRPRARRSARRPARASRARAPCARGPTTRARPLPSGNGHEERRVAGHHAQPVRRELEVPDHLGPQHARDVGGRRGPAARGDLLGHAGAADDLPPLDDERREPGARQVGRGRQAVVASARRRWRRRRSVAALIGSHDGNRPFSS